MNYTYNVTVNFNESFINFYEWNENDNITRLNKTLLYEVDMKTYHDILNKNIIVDKNFLDTLIITNYTCIFTTEVDAICVKFNLDGTIKFLSKLLLDEEKDILEELSKENKIVLNYKKISNKQMGYSKFTRSEKQNIDKILNFLIKEKNNTSLIEYLYYEWFNKIKTTDKFKELYLEITKEYCDKHDKLLKIIELLSYNNV